MNPEALNGLFRPLLGRTFVNRLIMNQLGDVYFRRVPAFIEQNAPVFAPSRKTSSTAA
jgi:hypothetical protein